MGVKVSVIIPTFHDWERLKLCLKALQDQTIESESYEVLVINNDPGDSCPYSIRDSKVRIIAEAKPGSYAARNAALKYAQGSIIAFTDSDCIPAPDWLENAVDRIENSEANIIAGEVELFAQVENLYYKYEQVYGFPVERYVKQENFGVTANLIVEREVFDDLGPFNSTLKSGGDKEFCQRAVKENRQLSFAEDVIVKHPSRNSLAAIAGKAKRIAGTFPQDKSSIKRFLIALSRLRPPLADIGTALRNSQIGFGDKLAVIAMRIYVRYAGGFEAIRVYLGKSASRV